MNIETETEIERETVKQRDSETERQRDSETEVQGDRGTERKAWILWSSRDWVPKDREIE